VLEEHAELKTRMAARAAAGGLATVSEGFAEGAREAHQQAQRIRTVLFEMGNGATGADNATARKKPRARSGGRRSPRKRTRRRMKG
jgi:hypothetical protein